MACWWGSARGRSRRGRQGSKKGRRPSTALAHIVLVLRVRLERDLVVADAALDVEPVLFYSQIVVANHVLLAGVELLAAVHVLAALDALQREGDHHAYFYLFVGIVLPLRHE